MREMVGGCCVCSDDRGWSENPLVYCDGQSCNVAVHQACYGIVTVPTGPWFCCKCESQERPTKVKCELCPSKYGALKRTDNQGWAHVVCALYIPEVRFGNVSTMEPIQLQLIPAERFNKVCYICEEKGKGNCSTVGACMQCNKIGCKQQFHVTCAQSLGLLCEEAGNYLDNVKYCGYCQHHYSKLKKGGNVKTIPPYKPVSETTVNSDSEKESEGAASAAAAISGQSQSKSSPPSQAAGKRKSSTSGGGGGGKSNSSSKVANTSGKASGSQQKTVHSNNKSTLDKKTASSKVGGKTDPDASLSTSPLSEKSDKKDNKSDSVSESDKESSNKEPKSSSKKRKVNSRTPTPIQSEVSAAVNTSASSDIAVSSANFQTTTSSASSASVVQTDKKNSSVGTGDSSVEKNKKTKVDTTQSILSNQPVVALTSISNVKLGTSSVVTTTTSESVVHSEIAAPIVPTIPSIIQTAQAQAQQQQHQLQQQSLLVSVPLASTSLSPHHSLVNSQTSGLTVMPFIATSQDKSGAASNSGSERATPVTPSPNEMSGGGLKITYEKQPDSINTVMDMELEMDTPTTIQVPARRGTRSQSSEKSDRTTRGKKRNSTGSANNMAQMQTTQSLPATMPKRSSRSQHASPPPAPPPPPPPPQPQVAPPGAFAAISQEKMKDSPPSSPNSEGQGASSSRGRTRARKSNPTSVNVIQGSSKEEKKEVKMFQNGMTTAPHMLGNQLNPTSNMHQKMTDHLSNELEAHSIYHNSTENSPNLIGPQMHHKVIQSTRASSTGSSTASGGSGLSSMLGGGGGTIPQTLDQLLERQWEQGSQFLMEQAQHFDIASLLSCLHQLRAENLRLEDHVTSLIQRRDHLLAVNARLAIPLTGQPITGQPQSSHTVNNVHPSMSGNHVDMSSRSSRHNSGSYDRYPQSSHQQHGPLENGIPPEAYSQNPHRSPVTSGQPSPTVRW